MADGDKNTAFNHAVIKERRRRSVTQITLPNGTCTSDAKVIGTVAESFFKSYFRAVTTSWRRICSIIFIQPFQMRKIVSVLKSRILMKYETLSSKLIPQVPQATSGSRGILVLGCDQSGCCRFCCRLFQRRIPPPIHYRHYSSVAS